ncbi:MAG: hypothetical protein CML50_06490 [Rhodobacteraceae bacterium]|nr:hypothetical protein [Paracoccaceae bacterium]
MSEHFADIEARIDAVHKLEAVITAMRGIAASRVQESQHHLDSIRTFAATIGAAIGQALAFLPRVEPDAGGTEAPYRHAVLAFAAEQGFAGAFSDKVFDALAPLVEPGCELLLIGDRGLSAADRRGLSVAWSAPMISHPDQATALASRLSETIFRRAAETPLTRVSLVHAVPGDTGLMSVVVKDLVPFDYGRFPLSRTAVPPLITLPPDRLLRHLVEEYVFAELSEAIVLSFAAENEARMRAMIRAQENTGDTLDTLTALSRQVRQQDITEEIVELATASLTQGGSDA